MSAVVVSTSGGADGAIEAAAPVALGVSAGGAALPLDGNVGAAPAWVSTLPAGVISADLSAATAGGSLSYQGALQLLDDVASAGAVTASEFSQLQTLAAHLTDPGFASPWLAYVMGQLIDGSPQNATWTDQSPKPSPLGNLAVGTTPTHLRELIGQWLLDTNLPDPTVDTSQEAGLRQTTGYAAISGPLFGASGPSTEDICQGETGDCVLMAGLIDMVVNHPATVSSMIEAEAPGVWGVRFYIDGQAVWETVDDQLPIGAGGQLLYTDNPNDSRDAIWVSLVEKAYAQLAASGEIGLPATDSYTNISGDPADDVLQNLSDASQVDFYWADSDPMSALKPVFVADLAAGDDLMLEDLSTDTFDSSGQDQLISNHAFGIVGYDSTTGNFIVRNPWGDAYAGHDWDTQFEVSMQTIISDDLYVVVDNSGSTVAARAPIPHDLLEDGYTDFIIQNASGAVVVGEEDPQGQFVYQPLGALGSDWSFRGMGDFQWQSPGQYLIENSAGAVVLGAVNSSGGPSYAQIAALGPEWSFVETGDFLGLGYDQFLIESTTGAVVAGEVTPSDTVTYSQIGALGPEWRFVGAGDYLGDGRTQFLIENTAGALDLGEVGSNGQAAYTALTALGPEWSFEGSADFYGDGKDQVLMQNTAGAVVVGEVTGPGQIAFAQVAALGPEWRFVGVGDFTGDGQNGFLIENSAGALVVGTIVGGQAQYAAAGGLGAEWRFRS